MIRKLFSRWFGRSRAPMLDCDSVMKQLWDYLDEELTPERMTAVRAHVEMCSRCYPQYEFEKAFLEAVGKTRREYHDPERVRARLLAALRERGYSAT